MRRRTDQRALADELPRALLGTRIPLAALVQALAVAEHLSFRHAATSLGISQSSVSTRIKALEQDLGTLLFERRHRGVRLTEAGRRFVAEVSTGIDHIDLAIRTAGAISTGMTGQLAIGVISSIAGGFMADLRRQFRMTYPDIEQIVMEGASAKTVSLVRDGKLDIALVLGPVEAPDCHSRLLWSEAYLVALPAAHPLADADTVAWANLASETFLLRMDGPGPQLFEHVVRRMAERRRSPNILRCDVGRDTLMHMVASGEGVALVSEIVRYMNCPGVAIRPIVDETEQAGFSAIWSPHNRSPALRNFLDLAIDIGASTRAE